MKIIKAGDLKRLSDVHRFQCSRCGCIWEADRSEYQIETDFRNGHYFSMRCPTCDRFVTCYPEDERRD